MKFFQFILLFIVWSSPLLFADGLSVESTLEPQQIPLGGTAAFIIKVSGTSEAQVNIPPVDGLNIVYTGQESAYNLINGEISQQVVFYYQLKALKPGTYIISGVQVRQGGQTAQSETLRLQVIGTQGSSSYSSSTSQSATSSQTTTAPLQGNSLDGEEQADSI